MQVILDFLKTFLIGNQASIKTESLHILYKCCVS